MELFLILPVCGDEVFFQSPHWSSAVLLVIHVNQDIETQVPIHCILSFLLFWLQWLKSMIMCFQKMAWWRTKMGNSCVSRWVLEYPTTEPLSTTSEMFSKKVFDTATSGDEEQVGMNLRPVYFYIWNVESWNCYIFQIVIYIFIIVFKGHLI